LADEIWLVDTEATRILPKEKGNRRGVDPSKMEPKAGPHEEEFPMGWGDSRPPDLESRSESHLLPGPTESREPKTRVSRCGRFEGVGGRGGSG